ncbi:protochlorophyllide oxidoreductase [Crocosphaera sp. UHCC 0190]|uniref:protochlorophyllide oxidoreductase n=1 Tax=Crocosphaera sp. UHCC 0190 TaxID=3110246 RepID=UPI002B218E58|nr:protochlorophyllide oxidoreductase [Crocosphaera sp. UHCC 0190]MEA5510233.1 protochlorophyllide oxidoreductase [Crocosphaera sp. UHCC 0190]
MKFNNTLVAILTVALTAGINVSVMANVPTQQQTQGESHNPVTETTQPQGCARC